MNPIKVLISAAGYQGGYSLVKALKETKERDVTVIGTDMDGNSAARLYCDAFYKVPPSTSRSYNSEVTSLLKIIQPDVVIPASSAELLNFHVIKRKVKSKILISDFKSLVFFLDKIETYNRLKGIVPIPNYLFCDSCYEKPKQGKGGKGIVLHKTDETFIMECLKGEQIDIDVLSWGKELLLAVPKIRERAYGGTLIQGEIVKRPELVEQIQKIINEVPFYYLSVFQFIGGKLLEINPRMAGSMVYAEDFNLPYLAIKLALKELKPKDIKQWKIPYGKRITKTMVNL